MSAQKLGELSQLVGETITLCEGKIGGGHLAIRCESGKTFELIISDEGCGGNDSYAFISDMSIPIGSPIVSCEARDSDSYGVTLILNLGIRSKDGALGAQYGRGFIRITHDHNGYYGFSWDLTETTPTLPTS